MVPWAEVWSNWGVRQTRFMATITFFPVPHPASQAQSSPKKPPLERWSAVKKFCSAVTSLFDFFIWLLASLVCVSPKFVHPLETKITTAMFVWQTPSHFSLIHTQTHKIMTRQNVKSRIRNVLSTDEVFWPLRKSQVSQVGFSTYFHMVCILIDGHWVTISLATLVGLDRGSLQHVWGWLRMSTLSTAAAVVELHPMS